MRLLSGTIAIALFNAAAIQAIPAQLVVRESARDWQDARRVTLEVQKRWCVDVDAPGCDLKSIDEVTALPDGGIIASDIRGPIHRFTADGRFIGELGRRGKGPGEYGFVVSPQLLPSGLVAWFDNTQMRVTTIALDGKAGPITRLMPPQTMANLFLAGQELVIFDVPATAPRGDTVDATYRTVPASGASRILARVRTPSLFDPGTDMRPMGGPFDTRFVADVNTRGDVAHSNGGRYLVDVFPRSGDAWRLEIDAPAKPIRQADRDSAVARMLRSFRVTSVVNLPPPVRATLEQNHASFPPLSTIRVLRDGTVWIRPSASVTERTVRWDVFSATGQRIGMAQLPAAARVRDGERGWILVVQPGEDDVPEVVRYRVGP